MNGLLNVLTIPNKALLLQMSNVTNRTDDVNDTITTEDPSAHGGLSCQSVVYGYGTLAVLIISLPPLLAVTMARLSQHSAYKYVLNAMLGLGVGSLIGDTFLHLVPEVFEATAEESEEGGHSDEVHISPYFWKFVLTCAAVWVYFILQLIIQAAMLYKKSNVEVVNKVNVQTNEDESIENVDHVTSPSPNGSKNELISEETRKNRGLEAVGWMVTFGDMMHNFTDGMAIGAAFCDSTRLGISTTIAIFVHEVPQEFGDAALMLASGWSWPKVLLFNCISQVAAFVGLYIGIGVSQTSQDAESWILAITAGTFVYLALSDAVPEILEICGNHGNVLIYICPNIGILVGYVIMILLAIYEEHITI